MVPSVSVPEPESDTDEVGSVIDWSVPAFAVGAVFEALFTVTETSSVAVAPPLSVTVRRNTYEPAARPVTFVDAEEADAIVADPPDTLVHAYEAMVPSESVPEPVRDTEEVGSVIDWSVPAFAEGVLFEELPAPV